jgi:hypothetical protein
MKASGRPLKVIQTFCKTPNRHNYISTMGDKSDMGVMCSAATFVLLLAFVIVAIICVIPNLYWIQQNTSRLNQDEIIPQLLQTLHEDLLVMQQQLSILNAAAALLTDMNATLVVAGNLLVQIEENTSPVL